MTDAGGFDVLAFMPGPHGEHLSYRDLAPRAMIVDVGGSTVTVASIDDVIASKQWANRPKDRDALPELIAIHDRLAAEAETNQPADPMTGDAD